MPPREFQEGLYRDCSAVQVDGDACICPRGHLRGNCLGPEDGVVAMQMDRTGLMTLICAVETVVKKVRERIPR